MILVDVFFVFWWILTNICSVATDFLEANSSRALLKKCIAVFALAEIHGSPPLCFLQDPWTHIVDVASVRQGHWALCLVCSSLCTMITRRLHVRMCSLGMLASICYMMFLFFLRAMSYMAILLSLQQSHTNGFSPHVCAQGCYQKRYYSIWYMNKLERTSNDFLLFVLMGF